MNKRQKIVQQQFIGNEEKVIKRLKQVYGESLKSINAKTAALQEEIEALTSVYDKVEDEAEKEILKSRIRSKVYQKTYQESLQKQVSDILDKMQNEEFSTVAEYLNTCYEDGFVGTMYDLQGQGIPLCFPLDQEAMTRAVQLDSKISQGLYTRLGEDVAVLKKKITAQVSRGIATGMSFAQVAQQLAAYSNIGFNNAVRIARTEGHRIQVQSGMDACYKAKEKGADVVKQWDSTLDAKTRSSHVRVDGEVKELDEKFSNGLMFPGDPSGGAAEVVNCRCALLQRARWAVKGGFTKMNNFTKEIETFESPEAYDEFKKGFFSKENKRYMNYVQQMEEKYGTTNFEAVMGMMNDREYKHLQKLLAANPMYNKQGLTNTGIDDIIPLQNCQDFEGVSKYLSKTYGIAMDDTVKDLDFESVKEGIQGIEKVMLEFPQAQSSLKKISTNKSGIMCAQYNGTINFNPHYYKTRESAVNASTSSTGFHPKGNNVTSTGSHEMGHILEKALIDKDKDIFFPGAAWSDCTCAKKVVSEACKAAKKTAQGKGKLNSALKREVSGYATQDASECLAEAVADYTLNGSDAAILSQEIWKILKRELG